MSLERMVSFSMIKPKNEIEGENSYIENLVDYCEKELDFEIENYEYNEEVQAYVAILNKLEKTYLIEFKFRTYQSLHLIIEIYTNLDEEQTHLDEEAHILKYEIKNRIIREWEECIWFEDVQSTLMCNELYFIVYNLENKFRNFINEVLTKVFGVKWWEQIAPSELRKRFNDRIKRYRKDITEFNNVNINLLGLDANHLTEIINITIEKWEPAHDQNIEEAIKCNDSNKVFSLLKNQMKVEKSIWQDIFKEYINDENFLEKWEEFVHFRNHVAHNKLMDIQLYKKIKQHGEQVEIAIAEAIKNFNENTISKEETRIIQQQYLKRYYNAIEADTHITIKTDSEILLMIEQEFDQLKRDIIGKIDEESLQGKLEFNTYDLEGNEKKTVLSIINSNNDSKLNICSQLYIDPTLGEQSRLTLTLDINNVKHEECTIIIQNAVFEQNEDMLYECNSDYQVIHNNYDIFFEKCLEYLVDQI